MSTTYEMLDGVARLLAGAGIAIYPPAAGARIDDAILLDAGDDTATLQSPDFVNLDLTTAEINTEDGIGVYHADGTVYGSTDTAIFFKNLPPKPDRAIVLSPFGYTNDQPEITYGQRRLQLRFRGTADPTDVDDLADAAFAILHGLTELWFGDVHVVQILRENSIPLGQDEQDQRWQRADNYVLDIDDPSSAHRAQ